MRRLLESSSFWLVLSVVLLLVGVGLTIGFWDWLHPESSPTASNSETLRNSGILIGGVLAFVFAVWRGWVTERQANAARSQAETAEQALLNERYQRGVEMLYSEVPSVRLGGSRVLQELVEDRPDLYSIRVTRLLFDSVSNPTGSEDGRNGPNSDEELP